VKLFICSVFCSTQIYIPLAKLPAQHGILQVWSRKWWWQHALLLHQQKHYLPRNTECIAQDTTACQHVVSWWAPSSITFPKSPQFHSQLKAAANLKFMMNIKITEKATNSPLTEEYARHPTCHWVLWSRPPAPLQWTPPQCSAMAGTPAAPKQINHIIPKISTLKHNH